MGFLDIFRSKKGVIIRQTPFKGGRDEQCKIAYEAGVKSLQDDNYRHAFDMFTLCSENGHISSKYNLALMYRNALGCDYDFDKCIHLLQEATEQGHGLAKKNLDIMIDILNDRNTDFNKIAMYLSGSSGNSYGVPIFFFVDYITKVLYEHEIREFILHEIYRSDEYAMVDEIMAKGRIVMSIFDKAEPLSPRCQQMLDLMDLACNTAIQLGKSENEIIRFRYHCYSEVIVRNIELFAMY